MTDVPDPEDVDSVEDLLAIIREQQATINRLETRLDNIGTAVSRAHDRLDDAEADIDGLTEQVTLMDATMPQQNKTKLKKVRDILEYGKQDATGGAAGVKVTTGEAAAAAGCSRNSALRLMDEIGSTFSWATAETPGGPNPKELRLKIRAYSIAELMEDVRDEYGAEGGASA